MGTDRPTPYDELMRMSDAELIAHARERHPDGAAGLETAKRCVALVYERHRAAVRAMCAGRAPAGAVDDLEGEVYARFVRTIYTHATPVERPFGLLVRIAQRVVATFYDRRPPAGAQLDDVVEMGATEDGYGMLEAQDAAERLLGVLNDRQREVVWLRVLEDLPSAEVAGRLGMTVTNVDVVFYRAMKRLQEELPEGTPSRPSTASSPRGSRASGPTRSPRWPPWTRRSVRRSPSCSPPTWRRTRAPT